MFEKHERKCICNCGDDDDLRKKVTSNHLLIAWSNKLNIVWSTKSANVEIQKLDVFCGLKKKRILVKSIPYKLENLWKNMCHILSKKKLLFSFFLCSSLSYVSSFLFSFFLSIMCFCLHSFFLLSFYVFFSFLLLFLYFF